MQQKRTIHFGTQDAVTTYVDDYGRSWVQVDTELWARAQFTDYLNGIPLWGGRR